jgi:NADH:ubiquinone oxidoreductase subunit F (NADH-binding)
MTNRLEHPFSTRAQAPPSIRRVNAPLLLVRLADAPTETFAGYRARGGYSGLLRAIAAGSPAAVLDAIEQSMLRGRGGASFPTAKKWRLAASQPGPEKFVVGNGGEHEPGSEKDRHLVARYPHAVLEGLPLPEREKVVIPTYADRDRAKKEARKGAPIFGAQPPKPAAT